VRLMYEIGLFGSSQALARRLYRAGDKAVARI
jgi:hypothetical protein